MVINWWWQRWRRWWRRWGRWRRWPGGGFVYGERRWEVEIQLDERCRGSCICRRGWSPLSFWCIISYEIEWNFQKSAVKLPGVVVKKPWNSTTDPVPPSAFSIHLLFKIFVSCKTFLDLFWSGAIIFWSYKSKSKSGIRNCKNMEICGLVPNL